MESNKKYWLAGILEGEGAFMKGPPSEPNLPRLAVQMTDYDIILKIKNITKSGTIQKCIKQKDNHKDSWRWVVKGKPAINIMELIYNLMSERRKEQINRAIGR
jgi:hypothetical protein